MAHFFEPVIHTAKVPLAPAFMVCTKCGGLVAVGAEAVHESFHQLVELTSNAMLEVAHFFNEVEFENASEKTQGMAKDIENRLNAAKDGVNESNEPGT